MSEVPHKAFWDRLPAAIGEENARLFRDALALPPSVSVRLNPFKRPSGEPLFAGARPVAWSAGGRMLAERPVFTLDPAFHAGAYYVQDSSSMAVGEVLRRCLPLLPEGARPLRVLDACAAPGGKTTDAAASLRKSFGNGFLLVANEPVRPRAAVLKDNVAVWGDPCVSVTGCLPAVFGEKFPGFFDIILTDVPCSGEGMFRKEEEAVRGWSPERVHADAALQRKIVSDLWPSLREGGILVYSTCTLNTEENGDNVAWIASTLGAEVITPELPFSEALAFGGGYLFVPGRVEGEGQFVAALRKCSPAAAFRLPKPPRSLAVPCAGLLPEPCAVYPGREGLVAVPEGIAAEMAALLPANPLSVGTCIGQIKGKDFVPSADLALSLLLSPGAFPTASLGRETALAFLHRDAISLPDAPKGLLRVEWKGLPLGFVKNLGPRCNNLHPKDRRIRMDI